MCCDLYVACARRWCQVRAELRSMMDKREAAFHHAGHAVATHLSDFHVLAAPLNIATYGNGEIVSALSRRKLTSAGKVADLSSRMDPQVASGIAVILCAGLASETLASELDLHVCVRRSMSAGDLALAKDELRLAGLPDDTAPYESAAKHLLSIHWAYVVSVADALLAEETIDPARVHELMPRPH